MNQEQTARQVGVRHGLWAGLALILYGILYRVASLDAIPGLIWIFYAALPAAALLGQLRLRRERGTLTVRQGLAIALVVSLIASPIYSVYVWGFNKFIDDSLLEKVVEGQRESLAARGLAGEALETEVRTFEARLTPATLALFVMLRLIVFGLVAGSVISLFTRTSRQQSLASGAGADTSAG